MIRLARRCKLAVLVLALALLTPWSAEALPLDRPLSAPFAGVVNWLSEWFTILLGDIGCSADPGGGCHGTNVSQPPAPGDHLDVGCSLDPNGACGDHG